MCTCVAAATVRSLSPVAHLLRLGPACHAAGMQRGAATEHTGGDRSATELFYTITV